MMGSLSSLLALATGVLIGKKRLTVEVDRTSVSEYRSSLGPLTASPLN